MQNVKIFSSPERIILKVYNYDLCPEKTSDQLFIENGKKNCPDIWTVRSVKTNKTTSHKQAINDYNKMLNFLGYGLNNEWDYFFTGTIDPQIYDASDFDTVSSLISECFRKMRSKYKSDFRYCFILEKHESGNYHAHGFINIPGEAVNPFPVYERPDHFRIKPSPSKFTQFAIKQDFYPLGLNTISPINDLNSVTDYCAKYIGKAIEKGDYAAKSIFKSHGLKGFDISYGEAKTYSNFSCFNSGELIADQIHIPNLYTLESKEFKNFVQFEIKCN